MGAGRRTFGERSGFDLSAQPKVESGETGTKLELCPRRGRSGRTGLSPEFRSASQQGQGENFNGWVISASLH